MSSRLPYPQRVLRQTFREFLSENRWPLIALVASLPLAGVMSRLLSFWLGSGRGYLLGFMEGAMTVTVLATVGMLFLLHTEGLQQLAGAHGEGFTATQLERARKKGLIWGAVPNIELADGDVDSIVITPRGVIAIDSKWRFRKIDRAWLQSDLGKARKAARKTRSILRSQPIGQTVDVTPLLVVWGKGGRSVTAGGEQHDDVFMIDGTELVDWLGAWGRGPLAEPEAESLLRELRLFAQTHGPAVGIHR